VVSLAAKATPAARVGVRAFVQRPTGS
jgi:hypothetical protein